MMTMMRKASSIVLLLGLIAVTKAASAPAKEWKHKYIVKPTPMDAKDAKVSDNGIYGSKLARYIEAKKKYDAKVIEVEGLQEKKDKAEKTRDEWQKKINDGQAAAGGDRKGAAVTPLKEASETKKTDLDTANNALAEEKKKKYNKEDGAYDNEDSFNKRGELKGAETAQKKAAKEAEEAKDEYEKLKKIFDDYIAGMPEDAKEAEYDTTDKDVKAKLKGWAKTMRKHMDDLEKAEAALAKGKQDDRCQKVDKDDKPKTDKDGNAEWVTPEAGGMGYWLKEMNDANDRLATQPLRDLDAEIGVIGFYGDVHGTEVLIGSDKDLDYVKALFEYPVLAAKPEDKKVFATVTQDDKAVPSVTVDSYLRITEAVTKVKNHMGSITDATDLQVLIETFTVQRDQKDEKGDPKPKTGEGETGNKQEPVKRMYLNLQKLIVDVYKNTEKQTLIRDSTNYDVLGNKTDMSAAAVVDPTTGSSPKSDDTTTKDKGSNAWMIIGIICLVVIFLGGAVIAYRAYTASGSLQNTDI